MVRNKVKGLFSGIFYYTHFDCPNPINTVHRRISKILSLCQDNLTLDIISNNEFPLGIDY